MLPAGDRRRAGVGARHQDPCRDICHGDRAGREHERQNGKQAGDRHIDVGALSEPCHHATEDPVGASVQRDRGAGYGGGGGTRSWSADVGWLFSDS